MQSSRKSRFVLLLSVAISTVITASGAEAFDRVGWTDEYFLYQQPERFTRLDSTELEAFIVATMEQYHVPGVAACVTKDADIVWTGAYGLANIEDDIAVCDTTMFLLASVSKLVTGTAVMQLCEDSLFGLDDSINDYLTSFQVIHPQYPSTPITFRMLLTHTAQIVDQWSLIMDTLYTFGADSPIPLEDFLQGYLLPGGENYNSGNWTEDPPGSGHVYSCVGFALLGYLVEVISGMPFDEYCNGAIFEPLGMNRTSWRLLGLDQTTIAMPYKWQGGTHVPWEHYGYPYYPAGLLRSSTVDLSRFFRAFLQEGEFEGSRILESTTVDTMTTHQLTDIIYATGYSYYMGLAWLNILPASLVDENIWCWGHTGGDWGVNTCALYSSAEGENWESIVLMNLYQPYALAPILYEVVQFAHDTFGDTSAVLSGTLAGNQLQLSWTPIPQAAEYWVYGAPNQPYFSPGFAPGYEHRLVVLSPWSTTWSSSNGICEEDNNWTYQVIAVNGTGGELWRSNRVGEHDFGADIP